MKFVVVVVSVVLMVGSAQAQAQSPSQSPVQLQLPSSSPSPSPSPSDSVSPTTALVISLGGTLASYGLIAGGISSSNGAIGGAGVVGTFIMPSAGRWYAHSSAFAGLALRLVGVGTAVTGFAIGFHLCFAGLIDHSPSDDQSCHKNENTAMALMALGGLTYLGATVYDIIRAPLDARAYNEAHRTLPVAIVPVVAPAQHQYGLALAGQF